MAIEFENSISHLSTLDLWFKVSEGSDLFLTDIPELIRLRWPYFRDNWFLIREQYVAAIPTYFNQEKLRSEILLFDNFIQSETTSRLNKNPFDSDSVLYRFFSIFDLTLINSSALSFEERNIVTNKINYINSLNRSNFIEMRSAFIRERDAIADRVNLSDPFYNTVFNRSSQPARTKVKNNDLNNMYEIQQAIKSVDFILANYFTTQKNVVDPFTIAKANANNPEINIGQYSSGELVKINYGEDLQSLAQRTLGSREKWIDIAIANGLKAPYIDEVGTRIPLLSNGSRNQINISGLDTSMSKNIDKLYVGQHVYLQSNVRNFPEQRSVVSIREIPVSGEIILELDGAQDLDEYKTSEAAHIRVYKPNTINSSFYVLIPSNEQLSPEITSPVPWFLSSSDSVEVKQKVDLNISENGDLNFNSTGDLQLTYGIDNSIQALKLKMVVEVGENRQHLTFGLPPFAGLANNDINGIKNAISSAIVDSVSRDSRFAGIDSISVNYSNPTDAFKPSYFSINLVVKLNGSDQLVPISFNVRG